MFFGGGKIHPIVVVLHDLCEEGSKRGGIFFLTEQFFFFKKCRQRKLGKKKKTKKNENLSSTFLAKEVISSRVIVRMKYNVLKIFNIVPVGAQ